MKDNVIQSSPKEKIHQDDKIPIQAIVKSGDVDKVRKLVEEEGREARNLLTWNVPVSQSSGVTPLSANLSVDTSIASSNQDVKKPPVSPRIRASPRQNHLLGNIDAHTGRPMKRLNYEKNKTLRSRSASVGRNPKEGDIYSMSDLFSSEQYTVSDDLFRSVSPVSTPSILLEEAIMVLENYVKEFTSLIEWLKLNQNFENTAPTERPTSLAWEVKKSSPGRPLPSSPTLAEKKISIAMGSPVRRQLIFSSKIESSTQTDSKINLTIKEESNSHSNKTTSQPLKPISFSNVTSQGKISNFVRQPSEVKKTHLQSSKNTTNSPSLNRKPLSVFKIQSQPSLKTSSTMVRKPVKSVKPIFERPISNSTPLKSSRINEPKLPGIISNPLSMDQKSDPNKGSSSSLSSTSSNGRSWADKVKGMPQIPPQIQPITESGPAKPESMPEDNDGWETVHRGKNKLRTPPPSGFVNDRNKCSLGNKSLSETNCSHSQYKNDFKNPRRKFRISPEKSITGKQRRFSDNSSLQQQARSAKSMPSLDRKFVDNSSKITSKNSSKPKEICKSSSYSKAKSLPDVTQNENSSNIVQSTKKSKGINLSAENLATKYNESKDSIKEENCEEKREIQVKNSLDSNKIQAEGDVNPEDIYDWSQEDQDEIKELDASLELVTLQEHNLMMENNQDTKDMISLMESDRQKKIEEDDELLEMDSYTTKETKITNWAELVMLHESEMAYVESMEQSEMRQPGRALQMHEKLSSPSRKRSVKETRQRHEEKQAKAQEQRERILEDKAQKLRDQSKKIDEVRTCKEELVQRRKGTMENKLDKAEQKRKKQIQLVVKKAHDEEEKVNEIAFINTLEAQNKRHDVLTRHKDHEARLHDIQEERQKRLVEKAAKEVAAEERRKALESERLSRLQEIQEKRKIRDMKIEQQQQEKEKERIELAREKARDREQRISALNAQQNAVTEELQRKIKIKQEESARRHGENIEQKRQKAFELSVRKYSSNNDDAPRLILYELMKQCTLCNVLISSEVYLLSHLRGKTHCEAVIETHEGNELGADEMETYNLKLIVDAPPDKVDTRLLQDRERQKTLKKRCKKIRHRMMTRFCDIFFFNLVHVSGAVEYENIVENKKQQVESQNKAKLARCIKDINKCIQNQGTGPWTSNQLSALERTLGEVNRTLEKRLVSDQIAYRVLGGLVGLMKLLNVVKSETKDVPAVIPTKTLSRVCTVFRLTCASCRFNCNFVLYSNLISNIIDLTIHKLSLLLNSRDAPSRNSPTLNVSVSYVSDAVAGNLMHVVADVLACLAHQPELTESKDNEENGFQSRAQDVVSYIVSVGIVDRICECFQIIQGPIDNDPDVAEFLHQCILLLIAVIKLLSNKYQNPFGTRKNNDVTQLISTLSMTELVCTVSMLYGILLHGGAASPEGISPPPQLPDTTINLIMAVLQMLTQVAILDLKLFQKVLGSEGTSLEFRHISSYLMWYCSHWPNDKLLNEVIALIGYFTVLNSDNQVVLQSGHYPTVLQQLCALPFHYFSDPVMTVILFPTLIACCHGNSDNKEILEQDMSSSLLANFVEAQQFVKLQANLLPSKTANIPDRWAFQNRFPEEFWDEARNFLSANASC
ncbi:S phase cyclin A-associated protein in the endoplasmic reticulum [Nymphon striatum]|nr:S phase cyclin A-associated protein in the endoplasmic reticulum [Nymphon striatum]